MRPSARQPHRPGGHPARDALPPPYLKEAFSKATITGPDGTIRPLVSETHVIGAGEADEPEKDIWDLFTPLVCAWLLFGIVLGLTWIEWRKKNTSCGWIVSFSR